jgi:8-oxo-dGTP pyrophosphatase MutT (NUDIX family)
MPKPTDPSKWAFQFSDDFGFSQKIVLIHPSDPTKFLALKRSEKSTNSGLWDLPGGNVLFGQLHQDSLFQEILEETCISEVENIRPVFVKSIIYEETKFYRLLIGYAGLAQTSEITLSEEHDEYRWLTANEFLALDAKEGIKMIVRRAFE